RLVEAMDLVHEEDGLAAAPRKLGLGCLHRFADLLHAGKHRRNRDELGVEGRRHEARDGGLAGSRRTPEDHGMRLAGFESQAHRLASDAAMLLADDYVDRARAQGLRKRGSRLLLAEQIVHWSPNTSTRFA